MSAAKSFDALDAARTVLLGYEGAGRDGAHFLSSASPLSGPEEASAIQLLDAAGAIEAVLDCDFTGNRRWRVRAVTSAGHDVARLIREERVWLRLKQDLARGGDPFGHLVRSYDESLALA
jgi:hypothetical protein